MRFAVFLFFGLACLSMEAQSFVFGPKFGPGFGRQSWNNVDRDVLLVRHIALFIESYDERNPNSSLFAQIGYHQRGSSQNFLTTTLLGNALSRRRVRYEYNNISLLLGAKRILNENSSVKPYYTVGIRGEYTIDTNLDQFSGFGPYFPNDFSVNKINYGFSVGGGFQKEISELVGAQIELTISPDLSKQYFSPPLGNVLNPFGQPVNIGEQSVRNITLEISVGLRLLRKVEYID